MKKYLIQLTIAFTILVQYSIAQTLVINEISQGNFGQEYVEFVVIGDTLCTDDIPCLDLRKVIFDDNNGWSGTEGVSTGAMRFANTPLWSCIPQGTIIVVYNSLDKNPLISGIDSLLNDGNSRLILPSNSNFFESAITSPSGLPFANPTYPADQLWVSGGDWSTVSMNDASDAFQLPLTTGVNPTHSVSWGGANLNPMVYFPGTTAGKVLSMKNIANNSFINRANWSLGTVGVDETPGIPNSVENERYIRSVSRDFGTLQMLGNNFSVSDESCLSLCDGSASSIPQNGASGYKYIWSTGDSTQSISDLCPGDYSVIITDKYKCIFNDTVNIKEGTTPGSSSFDDPVIVKTTDPVQDYNPVVSSGKWSASCGTCIDTNTGFFDPAVSGEGFFTICHITGVGACADTTCKTQQVRNCDPESTYEFVQICEGLSHPVFGTNVGTTGVYSKMFTSQGGCDSTSVIEIQVVECDEGPAKDFGYELPNVFTPNGDGTNDRFILDPKYATITNAYVVSRWGQNVYAYSKSNIYWDGFDQKTGTRLEEGVYFYNIEYKDLKGQTKVIKGFVTLAE
ncbi:MAG: gliding motility-associated C-terminal domain-containing protein [Bacteroidetes bacterium]|nr:gliding motility-associated C-terminal domain-containing protein [Bacteroidota bacterium]